MRRVPWRLCAHVLVLAASYALAATLGLRLATIGASVTLVWPGTGIALAALWFGGLRLWPGVFLGAFVANALIPGVPLPVVLGVAAGNTLEAVAGAYLLRRSRFDASLQSIGDVVRLVGLAAVLSTTISATVGVVSLELAGLVSPGAMAATWLEWWVGDLMGDLVVAPVALAWASVPLPRPDRRRVLEAAALLVTLLAVGALALADIAGVSRFLGPYALFPILLWAAVRFGSRGVVVANAALSAMAIWATARGLGPFAGPTLDASLLSLQTFMGVFVLTSLVLAAAVAERNQAVAAREVFISIASHELRTPLTPLRLSLFHLRDLLGREASALSSSPGIEKAISLSERQVDRLDRLASNLLDVARSRTGKLSIEPEPLDLAALVRETVDGFHGELARARCALELHAEEPVLGRWDRTRLQQTVSNLVSNAIKFGAGKPITVSVARDGGRARLHVRDHGMGIEPAMRTRIFDCFERTPQARSTPGLGLGLYIVRQIVEAHGGSIAVDSAPQEGSAFTVLLPVEAAEGAPHAA